MMFRVLADATVVVHGAFVLFVLFGGLVVFRWPRLAWLHVPAMAWGAWIEFAGWPCPLTYLENWFRARAGGFVYSMTFIERHLIPLIYPPGLSREVQVMLGAFVLLVNATIYSAMYWRRER